MGFRLSCVCSRSQGQPPGARSRAINSTNSANFSPVLRDESLMLLNYKMELCAARQAGGGRVWGWVGGGVMGCGGERERNLALILSSCSPHHPLTPSPTHPHTLSPTHPLT